MPDRSPGAVSTMSGTTAISFSMSEASSLEPRYILKHMHKLCNSAEEFLEHLAPDNGSMHDDMLHINEMQKPDSEFVEDYRDFDNELKVHLTHFIADNKPYISVRAVNHALFGLRPDVATSQSGLNLILYLANLLVFAKQMIYSDRNEKEIWNEIRNLDLLFPSQFMHALDSNVEPTPAGDSQLLQDTFSLALELRTQLAILVLEQSIADDQFDPDDALGEVFFRSESSQDMGASTIRGWNLAALGGEDSALAKNFENLVVERVQTIRQYFLQDDASLEQGNNVDIDGLIASFPWEATILQLLHWVRLRHRELRTTINTLGGGSSILENVKQEIEGPQHVVAHSKAASVSQESPRRKRRSFGRERRRSSRKFDPNAPVDPRVIDALKARERLSEASTLNQAHGEPIEVEVHETDDDLPVIQQSLADYEEAASNGKQVQPERDIEGGEGPQQPLSEPMQQDHEEQIEEEERSAGPFSSSAAILKAIKAVFKPEKENRTTSLFQRQENAQRVEFGDGFSTQPSPGPSSRDRGKQPAQPSPSKKRAQPDESEEESDDDAFVTEDRTANIRERRRAAPVAKKVRIEPTSSGAPPSHQPPPRSSRATGNGQQVENEQDASVSEAEAPEMTEEAPPSSTYRAQLKLAKQNRITNPATKERKPRTAWTEREENAFIDYMRRYPAQYSQILTYDKNQGEVLKYRSQINLKDKARTMAINMVK